MNVCSCFISRKENKNEALACHPGQHRFDTRGHLPGPVALARSEQQRTPLAGPTPLVTPQPIFIAPRLAVVDAAGLYSSVSLVAGTRGLGRGVQTPERTTGVGLSTSAEDRRASPATFTRRLFSCTSGAVPIESLTNNSGRSCVPIGRPLSTPSLPLSFRSGIHQNTTGVSALPAVLVIRGCTDPRELTAVMGFALHVARPSAERSPAEMTVPIRFPDKSESPGGVIDGIPADHFTGLLGSTVSESHAPRKGFKSVRKAADEMGRARSAWAIALEDQRHHHRILARNDAAPVVTEDMKREERQARADSEASAALAKTRGDVINLLTGDVQDIENIERKCRAAKVPIDMFGHPLDAA